MGEGGLIEGKEEARAAAKQSDTLSLWWWVLNICILHKVVFKYSGVNLVQPNMEELISQLLFGLKFWRSLKRQKKSPMHCTIHLEFT